MEGHERRALQHGEIIAPSVGTDSTETARFHNSFQDIAKFLGVGRSTLYRYLAEVEVA